MASVAGLSSLGSVIQRQGSLSEQLADRIEKAISDGVLEVGAPVPSERLLAEQFGVSRTVVREAVRALVAKGLLDVRAGAGTVVTAPSLPHVAHSMSRLLTLTPSRVPYEKVSEVRQLLEIEIAGLAAERHTDADLDAMVESVTELGGTVATAMKFAQADITFHQALATATQNELFEVLSHSVSHVMVRVREAAFQQLGAVESAYHHHTRILAAVKRRDAEAARAAMRRHLQSADRVLRQVQHV